MTYIATFVPQAWIRDNAVNVDPLGDTSWDCTEFVNAADSLWRDKTLERGRDYDDILRLDVRAPDWVREYAGPFETLIEIEEEQTDA